MKADVKMPPMSQQGVHTIAMVLHLAYSVYVVRQHYSASLFAAPLLFCTDVETQLTLIWRQRLL